MFQFFDIRWRDFAVGGPIGKHLDMIFISERGDELLETQWIHLHTVDLADGERDVLVFDGDAQQRPCAGDMKSALVFAKIFQGGQCAWCFLNFIKNHECFALDYFALLNQCDFPYDALYVKVIFKHGGVFAVCLEVDVTNVFEIF